jgi:hypothetical protein
MISLDIIGFIEPNSTAQRSYATHSQRLAASVFARLEVLSMSECPVANRLKRFFLPSVKFGSNAYRLFSSDLVNIKRQSRESRIARIFRKPE